MFPLMVREIPVNKTKRCYTGILVEFIYSTQPHHLRAPCKQRLSVFVTRETLCIIRIRSLLSMRCMLLGYSFESRPNSRALASGGSVMTTGLSINRGSHPGKLVWRERRRLTSPEVWAAVTSKVWRCPFLLLSQEDKRRFYSQAVLSPVNMLGCLCYFLKLWRPSNLAFQQKQKAMQLGGASIKKTISSYFFDFYECFQFF